MMKNKKDIKLGGGIDDKYMIPYKRMTKKQLHDIVQKIFRETEQKNNYVLRVNMTEDTMGFNLFNNGQRLYTGIRGYLNYTEAPWMRNFDDVYINGVKLDDKEKEEFLNKLEKLRK